MIVNLKLCHITILGVLSILSTHAQGRFESIAITLTSGQLVSSMELVESIADGHRTDLELILPQVVQTKISMVTIVQVSTTTIKEIVRVTETLSGTCAVAPSSAEAAFTVPVGDASGLSAAPTSTASVLGNIVQDSSESQAKSGSQSKGLPDTDSQPSAPSSRPCDCQCLCPISSFPISKVITASPVPVISTFQTLPDFVTPGQSIIEVAPSEPSPVAPAQTVRNSITLTSSSGFPPPSSTSTPDLISSGNIPFDIKTFSLLDEVTVPINI